METLFNARDIGGYATMDGKVTKYGRFIRSELPCNLSEKDSQFLRDYGVKLTLDFRTDFEVNALPCCLMSGHPWQKYVRSAMSDKQSEPPIPEKNSETKKSNPALDFLNPDWIQIYLAIAENGKSWVKNNMEIAAGIDGAILYHCMTGKDRTGLFTAMLLGLCNCYPSDIIADYSISQINLRPFYLKMMRFPEMLNEKGEPDLTLRFYQTNPENMFAFLQYIDEKYGSMTAYLTSCGIAEETLRKIADSLTEEAM